MFDWLFEGRLTVYVLLAGVAGLFFFLWTRDRRRNWLLVIGALALLIGVYFLLDRLVETGREQIRRKTEEMAAAVKARAADKIFQHISDKFHYHQSVDKARLRELTDRVLRDRLLEEIKVWDFEFPSGPPTPGSPARVVFIGMPEGGMVTAKGLSYRIEADFVQDPDRQWRMQTFEIHQRIGDSAQPIQIPTFP